MINLRSGESPNIELKISDDQMSKLFNLLLTLPFGNQNELEKETDGVDLRAMRAQRNIPIINSGDIPKELPLDFIAHKLQFVISKLSITIKDANQTVTQLSLESIQLRVNHRPSSNSALIDTCVKSLYISGIGEVPLLEKLTTDDVLYLKFDMNPLNRQYDYGMNV